MLSDITAGRNKHNSTWEGQVEVMFGFPQTLSHVHFLFVYLNLYTFTVLILCLLYNSFSESYEF